METYLFGQPHYGHTIENVSAEFAKRYGLPPETVRQDTPTGPCALCLIYAGPILDTTTMPAEAQKIIETRITELLALNPEGLSARQIAAALQLERPYSDTALHGLWLAGKLNNAMRETAPGVFIGIYTNRQ